MTKRVLTIVFSILWSSLLFGLAELSSSAQSSEWMEVPLPGSGRISALNANGGTLLAARDTVDNNFTNLGVYRSIDTLA